MIIDLFELARQATTASGEIALADLPRVETPDHSARLAWVARGSMGGRHGEPRLDLNVSGDVALICQRCLQPMTQAVAIATKFVIARDEATAEALDQDDDYDVIVGSTAFDLAALIEDEVILALPSAPRHRLCPANGDVPTGESRKPSPFAALAGFKTTAAKREDGSGEK